VSRGACKNSPQPTRATPHRAGVILTLETSPKLKSVSPSPYCQDLLLQIWREYGQMPVKLNIFTWRYLQRYRPELFRRPVPRHKTNGYIKVKRGDHRFENKRGYVPEHRYFWEKYQKACLLPWADVHHSDGVRDNNKITNLQAMMHRDHIRLECMKIKPWRGRIKQKQKTKEQGPIMTQLITHCKKNNSKDTSRDRDTSL